MLTVKSGVGGHCAYRAEHQVAAQLIRYLRDGHRNTADEVAVDRAGRGQSETRTGAAADLEIPQTAGIVVVGRPARQQWRSEHNTSARMRRCTRT